MLSNLSVAFIGSGAMAEAMIVGLISKKLLIPQQIIASGPRPERGLELNQKYGIRTTTDNATAVKDVHIVILAVKPQMLTEVARELHGAIPRAALLLSIMAGTTIKRIRDGFKHDAVVRSMPNTPAQIGEGIAVWTTTPEVTKAQTVQAEAILGTCGEQIFVEHEEYLDMATALSGNGPAYVSIFLEAMIDAGVHLGLSHRVAEKLVFQTVKGSMEYVTQSREHLARLRNQVTSPGGTCAESLYYLEAAGFRTALARAVWAGFERSRELGKGTKRGGLEKFEA